jgi:predicted porin
MRIPVTIFAVLLAFQATAQENKITVAGRAWGSVENVSTSGAPGATANVLPRFRVTNDASYVRVRGDLKLTDDLSAWGQVEAQFTFDGVGIPFDSGRNTGAGFTSKGLGTIMAGRWDSPYKLAAIRLDPWGDTGILSYANILGQLPGSGGNQYDARLTNNVQYWTPVISGFQVRLATEVNEDKNAQFNPWVFSASATYDGPIYLAAAYETRKSCFAGAQAQTAPACAGSMIGTPDATGIRHGRDWGVRLGAGINLKPTHTEIGIVYEHLEAQGDFTPTATLPASRTEKRDAYYLSLVQGLGSDANQIVAAIEAAGKASGNALATNDRTAAWAYTVALRHNFNKDLFVYAGFAQIRNEDNAPYRWGASGFTGNAGNPTGANYNGWVLGTRYLF